MSIKQISESALRWRLQVRYELERQKSPLPEELVLALIDVESRGVPGIRNPRSGASGLGQIMPIALEQYNRFNNPQYSMQIMQNKDPASANAQIRVTVWTLSQYWVIMAKSHAILGTVGDLARFADAAYCAGQGKIFDRLKKLPVATWSNFQTVYGDYAAVKNHTIPVFNRFDDSLLDENKILTWLKTRSKTLLAKSSILSPAVIALALIFIAYRF